MLSIIVLTSVLYAADIEPKIPSRFTCPIIRTLYKTYSRKYSLEEMEHFLRSKGISEARIEVAKRCLS
jgi:hypothetical protein